MEEILQKIIAAAATGGSLESVAAIAQKAGLNMTMYERDFADKKIQDHISRDLKDGSQAGVRGTPTLFINGKRLQNRSLKGFQQAIDLELKKLK